MRPTVAEICLLFGRHQGSYNVRSPARRVTYKTNQFNYIYLLETYTRTIVKANTRATGQMMLNRSHVDTYWMVLQ